MTWSQRVFERRKPSPWLSTSALALCVAACADAAPVDAEPAPNVSSPPEAAPGGNLDVIVLPGSDGRLPPDLWVGCEYGPQFQMSDLERIVALEEGDPGGVASAIESFLSSAEGAYWPQEGWQILRQTEVEFLLVHQAPDGLSFMTVSRVGPAWTWSGSQSGGPCPLHYLVPEGLNVVEWRVDPQAPPDARSTRLAVLVTERECVSGRVVGARLRGPQVVMTDDVVRLAFAAQPPVADSFTCPSNPESAATVELPAPLGDREIIEGLAIGINLEEYLD